MKKKIQRIDLVARKSESYAKVFRGTEPIADYPRGSGGLTKSSFVRAQRAQRVIAGFRVDEWPFGKQDDTLTIIRVYRSGAWRNVPFHREFTSDNIPCNVTGCHFLDNDHCLLTQCVE